MQQVGLYTRLKPGMEEAYEAFHAVVPADIVDDLRARGVSQWRIWRRGRELFHLVECVDYAAFAASPATNPTAAGWGGRMEAFLEVNNVLADPDLNVMRPVWALTENPHRQAAHHASSHQENSE
jgi:L-rhamnose mutarotase